LKIIQNLLKKDKKTTIQFTPEVPQQEIVPIQQPPSSSASLFQAKLSALMDMGFDNTPNNCQLLIKHGGNIDLVVQELLSSME